MRTPTAFLLDVLNLTFFRLGSSYDCLAGNEFKSSFFSFSLHMAKYFSNLAMAPDNASPTLIPITREHNCFGRRPIKDNLVPHYSFFLGTFSERNHKVDA